MKKLFCEFWFEIKSKPSSLDLSNAKLKYKISFDQN